MLRPDDRQKQAIDGMLGVSKAFTEEYIAYLEADRDYERGMMESASKEEVQVHQGRCQKLTDIIDNLKSLVAKKGG